MWECEGWNLLKTDAAVKSHLRENYKRPLSEDRLMQVKIEGRLSGYVQCDFEVPQHVRRYFWPSPAILKITVVSN